MGVENDDRTQRYDWNLANDDASDSQRGSVQRDADATRPIHRQEARTDEIDPVPPTQRMPVTEQRDSGETATRAYDFNSANDTETRVLPQQHAQQTAPSSAGAANTTYAPQQTVAPRQAPAAAPIPSPREWEDAPYGPSGGARVASIFVALLGALLAALPGLLQNLAILTGQSNPISDLLNSFGNWGNVVGAAILVLGWGIIAFSLAISGLGAGLVGGAVTVFSLGTFVAYSLAIEVSAEPWEWIVSLMAVASQLIGIGLALFFAGIAVHFARRGGFKKAVRLARGQRY